MVEFKVLNSQGKNTGKNSEASNASAAAGLSFSASPTTDRASHVDSTPGSHFGTLTIDGSWLTGGPRQATTLREDPARLGMSQTPSPRQPIIERFESSVPSCRLLRGVLEHPDPRALTYSIGDRMARHLIAAAEAEQPGALLIKNGDRLMPNPHGPISTLVLHEQLEIHAKIERFRTQVRNGVRLLGVIFANDDPAQQFIGWLGERDHSFIQATDLREASYLKAAEVASHNEQLAKLILDRACACGILGRRNFGREVQYEVDPTMQFACKNWYSSEIPTQFLN